MSDIVIRTENLGKKYVIGHQSENGRYMALRDVLTQGARSMWHKTRDLMQGKPLMQGRTQEEYWALRNVSFEIRRGEVVGIIGRNGAGKSTLLKIMSRITEPAEGRVRIRGRVASLLEVGTGFHPELSGRENIFLNGAILGMRREEIKRKFDEIVAFAEIDKFLDTPVKRYSTGMYVRLAFAVAAHLEPEILIIDEVLAVGDAEFQKKCLGKIGSVAKQGRTVLFVSHNLQSVQTLCTSTVLLDAGKIIARGEPKSIIAQYLNCLAGTGAEITWSQNDAPGNHEIKVRALRVTTEGYGVSTVIPSSSDIHVEIEFDAYRAPTGICIGFDLVNPEGTVVTRTFQTDLPQEEWPKLQLGKNRWSCTIPKALLNAGRYYVSPRVGIHNMYWIVNLNAVVQFQVVLDHGVSPLWNGLNANNRPGLIAPILPWNLQEAS